MSGRAFGGGRCLGAMINDIAGSGGLLARKVIILSGFMLVGGLIVHSN